MIFLIYFYPNSHVSLKSILCLKMAATENTAEKVKKKFSQENKLQGEYEASAKIMDVVKDLKAIYQLSLIHI